jgi:hypothetical protein
MQTGDMVSKKKLFFDGFEPDGLVSVSEISREKGAVPIPSFHKIYSRHNGTETIPPIEVVYKYKKNSETFNFFEEFFKDNEEKDGVLVETDGHGVEYARYLLSRCECSKKSINAYDASSPDYARSSITILPEDIITITA